MMAKQEQEKRKPGLLMRIIKWEVLGLLTILMILALVAQASWKIITLLAIILAACTILPKQSRKWFWLGVGAVILVLIIWIFLPEDNEGWRPYTFDKELAALEARYAIPDEGNAAVIYDALLRDDNPNTYYPDFLDPNVDRFARSEPWLSREYPELAQWLESHQNTIAELIQAFHKDKCYLPVPVGSLASNRHVERLAPTRRWTSLLLYAANNDIGEGRINAGIEKYLCLIQMANHVCQQPKTYQIINFQFERPILSLLNRFVIENQPTTEQLQRISNSIRDQEDNWGSDFIRIFEYNKLAEKNRFCSLAYEVNQKGKVRLSRNYWIAAVGGAVFLNEISTPTYPQRKLNKARTILNWFVYPSSPRKAAEILDRYFERYYAMAEPEYDWAKEPPQLPFSLWTVSTLRRDQLSYKCYARYTAVVSEKLYHFFHDTYLRILTLRRGSRLLIAIKQYYNENNAWPPNLDSIKSAAPAEAFIDPVTGNQLEYENHGERFSLYGETANIWPK